jgi:hypothetical protein
MTSNDMTSTLALSVVGRLNEEYRAHTGKARLIKLAGFGLMIFLTGLGAASALYGYSAILNNQAAADTVAKAFTGALERSTLVAHTSGTVALVPGSSVELKKGQMVRLDPNAHVEVDPNSVIRVEAGAKSAVPRPTDRQLQGNAPDSKNKIFGTSYTVFKTIKYNSGSVVTGWDYDINQPDIPRRQHCYYTRSVDQQAEFRVELGHDGVMIPASTTVLGRQASEAFGLCVWNGGKIGEDI